MDVESIMKWLAPMVGAFCIGFAVPAARRVLRNRGKTDERGALHSGHGDEARAIR